jgi:hypothetical protein
MNRNPSQMEMTKMSQQEKQQSKARFYANLRDSIKNVCWTLSVAATLSATATAQSPMTVIETNSDEGRKAIQLAVPEVVKRGLSLDGYRIVVMEIDGQLRVLFEDADAPIGQRGSSPKKLGLEVEVNKNIDRVTRVSFVR